MTHAERTTRRREMADFVNEGGSIREAAIKYEVSTTLVRDAYRVFYPDGAKPKKDLPRASKTIRIVAELLRSTDSFSAISSRVGTAYQRIQDVHSQMVSEGILLPERN